MSTLFRKIGGRIVPIRISSDKIPHSNPSTRLRNVSARVNGQQVGSLKLDHASKKFGHIDHVSVKPDYRKMGVGAALFEHAAKLLGKTGRTAIRSSYIEHEAQVKIRSKYRTTFMGKSLEGKKAKLSPQNAKDAVQYLKGQVNVSATTIIPKKFRGKK